MLDYRIWFLKTGGLLHKVNFSNSVVFFLSDLASINGDGAAQPVPSATEQQESSSADQTNDSGGASWPAPFEMPSSVSEDPGASSQVS